MATEDEVLKVLAVLTAAYPGYGRDIDPSVLEATTGIYQRLLADVPADVLEAAALQHIASGKFFPTVAELRSLCVSAAAPQYPSALEAWGEVLEALLRWNRYSMDGHMPLPEFSNPIIAQIVRSMGIIYLQESEDFVADRARFIQAYETLVQRAHDEVKLLPQFRAKRRELLAVSQPALGNGQPAENSPRALSAIMGAMGLR